MKDKRGDEGGRCLECGKRLPDGRRDMKFCSVTCKSKYHYRRVGQFKGYRMRVIRAIDRNYHILDSLLRSGVLSIDIPDLEDRGYCIGYVTAYHKVSNRSVCRCYDIKFNLTLNRIFGITRVSMSAPLKDKKGRKEKTHRPEE